MAEVVVKKRENGVITERLHAEWHYCSCSERVCEAGAPEVEAKSKFEKKMEISASETVESSRLRALIQRNISSVPIMVPGRKHPSTAVRTTDLKNIFLSTRFITLAIMKSECLTLAVKIRVWPVTP